MVYSSLHERGFTPLTNTLTLHPPFEKSGYGPTPMIGVGEAGEASASPLFSHQIKYAVQYSSSLSNSQTLLKLLKFFVRV